MLRSTINKRLAQIAVFPFFGLNNNHDIVPDKKLNEVTPTKICIDKIKDFIYKDDNISKEAQSIINAMAAGFFGGFCIGGIIKTKLMAENFVAENQATMFKNHNEGRRALQHKVFVALFKGGVPFGLKVGTFCFLFSTTTAILQSYKGKFDPLHHVIAGAVTGSIYKMNTGLKGAFAGGVLGTLLGTISGAAATLILYVTGTKMSELFEANNDWISTRKKLIKEQTQYMDEETKIFKELYYENQNIRKKVYADDKEKK